MKEQCGMCRKMCIRDSFYDALTEGGADAALAASLFHYKELEIMQVKDYLAQRGVPVRR